MQVDTPWVQPVVSDLAAAPLDAHQFPRKGEQHLSVQSPPLITAVFFPSTRVEPIDMARSHRQPTPNRSKAGYTQSATTDEHRSTTTTDATHNQPLKRVVHPADRSSVLFFLQRISSLVLTLLVSLPCVILLTLLAPLCWLLRTFVQLICRRRCPVTPCSCSYLSAGDLFWFYNSNVASNREKNGETTKLNPSDVSPTAAAIFFLEGNVALVAGKRADGVPRSRNRE